MKKSLFKKSSMNEIKQSAKLGDISSNPKYLYIDGYFDASNHLVNVSVQLENEKDKNSLIYPICFNYRHYIELHLKSLIEDAEILYDKMEKLGYLQNGKLPEKKTGLLDKTHNLNELLKVLENILLYIQISDEDFPSDIKKYIKQMHDTDKNGQNFRYYKNKSGKLHFPKEERYNIENMSKIMKEVNSMLWAVDSHIDYYITMSDDIISEYESEIGY